MMKIPCDSVTVWASIDGPNLTTVEVIGARYDVALDEIINEKGITFVLNAIGEQAIAEYLRDQGFHVLDNVKNEIKAV